MYADDDPQGRYPELSIRPGRLFWEDSTVSNRPLYPDYVTDPSVLVCPEAHTDTLDTWRKDNDPRLEDDHSYVYFGYAIRNQEDLIAFARGYSDQMAGTPDFSADLEHGDGAQPLVRLGSLVDLDAKTKVSIPVLIERPGNHASPGGNVLYFDGHVDFIDEGTWPYTEEALAVLNELDTQ
jgi:prepilin-type processing-associated H-X9-DG protein